VLYPSQLAVRDFVDTQILAAVPYTAENVANKVPSDITLDPTSTVLYPSNAAVVNFVAANLPSGWALAGNAGTTPGTDFIGTTDVKDLVFKTNGVEKMRIVHSGDYVEVKGGFSALSTNPLGNYVGCTDGIFSTAYLVNDPATHGGYLSLQNATGILAQITATNITSNRNYQLPDASGTLALTSDIPFVTVKPEYRARMFQSATGNPSDQATYIDSITVGTPFVSPTWRFITLSRISTGTYTLTITYDLVQVIIGNRAEISFSDNKITNGAYAQGSTGTSQSLTFTFYRYDSSGTLVDGINWTNVYLKLW
jgi:hypothetical protein